MYGISLNKHFKYIKVEVDVWVGVIVDWYFYRRVGSGVGIFWWDNMVKSVFSARDSGWGGLGD